jgi:tetratricopeptide (TPR) repeat protein
LLDSGIERRAVFDLDMALRAFDALIAYCPDYAEGYNQRAFVLFIRQDYAPALIDLDAALARSPEHLGALTGRSMALMALGRDAEALRDLEAALALNPWLKERNLLPVLRRRLGDLDL